MDIVNIVLVLLLFFFFFFLLPKFYCNIVTIRDVNLCANLYKNPKPKPKPKKYLEKYEQKQKASSLASIYFGSPGLNHTIKIKPYETSAC